MYIIQTDKLSRQDWLLQRQEIQKSKLWLFQLIPLKHLNKNIHDLIRGNDKVRRKWKTEVFDYSILIKTNIIAVCSKLCYVSIKSVVCFLSLLCLQAGCTRISLARTSLSLDRLRLGASYIDFIVIRVCSIPRCLVIGRGFQTATGCQFRLSETWRKRLGFCMSSSLCYFTVCVSQASYKGWIFSISIFILSFTKAIVTVWVYKRTNLFFVYLNWALLKETRSKWLSICFVDRNLSSLLL